MPAKPGDGFECCRGGMKGRRSPGPESKKETDSRTERPGQFLPEAPRHPASRAFQPQYIDQSGRPEQSARSPTPTAPCSPGTNVVRSGRPEQWLAPGGGPDKELYQYLRALRPTDPHNNTLLSCHGVKHLVKPLRALPRGDDTTRGLAAAHTTTGPSSGNLRGTPSIRMSASCGAPRSITTTES